LDALRQLQLHPASILAIPFREHRGGDIGVAVFDSTETFVFNQEIAVEMTIKIQLIYDQLFAALDLDVQETVEL
jgi:hypothetical protein